MSVITKPAPCRSYFVSFLRHAGYGDCSMNGVSKRFDSGILYRSEADVPAEPPKGLALLVLIDEPVCGRPYLKVRPAGEKRWCMFGGNFLWSSDSRFRQEVSERPIPVHDRIEG
jgi:hypothetical protein